MSKRDFTKEEIEELRANPYTFSVSPRTIYFTVEFKRQFWKRMNSGIKPYQIVLDLGYDPEVLGIARIEGIRQIVRKQGKEGNFREGQSGLMATHPDYSRIPQNQKMLAMETELYYLRQELAFIKKILKTGNGEKSED
jgi:hypothetical protein